MNNVDSLYAKGSLKGFSLSEFISLDLQLTPKLLQLGLCDGCSPSISVPFDSPMEFGV